MNPIIAAMIRRSGRSWWQARYSDGKVLSEWDTLSSLDKVLLPVSHGRSSRWEEAPKKAMIGLRLLCPNGMAGELEAPEGHRFFQLKHGGIDVLMSSGGSSTGSSRWQDAHIIGVVLNDKGDCLCRAWECKDVTIVSGMTTQNGKVGTNTLVDATKNWPLNILLRRWGPDYALGNTIWVYGEKKTVWGNSANTITIMDKWGVEIPTGRPYEVTAKRSQLIQFEDNIFDMRYLGIGPLLLDVQQLKV